LRKALARLPGIDCAALVLREIEQLPLDEVSWILAIDPEEVRRRIHRALLALTCAAAAWQHHDGRS
jgi:DNA-directed RNA polymerase specialized sigma24 family protein